MKDRKADKVVFVSGVDRYVKSAQAMVTGHKSQMVWFRWGWVGLAGLGVVVVLVDLRLDFLSLLRLLVVEMLEDGGGEDVLSCGANAEASTLAISLGSQVEVMPSLKRVSSSRMKTSSRRRTPRVRAAASSSLRRVEPRPASLPVERQRILRWLDNEG